jgi:hypothetical protein
VYSPVFLEAGKADFVVVAGQAEPEPLIGGFERDPAVAPFLSSGAFDFSSFTGKIRLELSGKLQVGAASNS